MFNGISPNPGSLGKGGGIVLGSTAGAFFVGFVLATMTGGAGIVVLLGIGVVQAAWIVPLWRYYHRMGETQTVQGFIDCCRHRLHAECELLGARREVRLGHLAYCGMGIWIQHMFYRDGLEETVLGPLRRERMAVAGV